MKISSLIFGSSAVLGQVIDYEYDLANLKTSLLSLQYPCALIDNAIAQALAKDQTELRKEKSHSEESDILAFVHTFNPRNPEVYKHVLNT